MATHRREARERARSAPPPRIDDTPDDNEPGSAQAPPDPDSKSRAANDAQETSPPGIADRWRRIAAAAYLRAERRGFAGGAELEDWLEAEKEVDAQLTREAADGSS